MPPCLLLLLLLLLLRMMMIMVVMTFVLLMLTWPVNHSHYLSVIISQLYTACRYHQWRFFHCSITVNIIISSSNRRRSLSPAAATRRPVGMATLPNSAADWSHTSQWRQRRQTRSASPQRDINAVGKSRQISLRRSNLSFIARINAGAQWTGRHLCRSSNITTTTSSSSSKYSMPNVCTYISISLLHLRPIQPQSRQVSLVTNQISRPIFPHRFIHRQLAAGAALLAARVAPNIRLSVILSHQWIVRAACGRMAGAVRVDGGELRHLLAGNRLTDRRNAALCSRV